MLAAWEPHFVHLKAETALVDRGDVVASIRFLMKRWRWGSGRTQRFIRVLERDRMVIEKRHGSGHGSPSVFSIVNYDLDQRPDDAPGTDNGTGSGTVAARSRHETKKGKNGKNATTPSGSDFDRFWTAYPKKVGIDAARQAWGRKRPDLAQVLAAIDRQQRLPEWHKDGGRFIPHPTTWLNQGRWQDEALTTAPLLEDADDDAP